MKVIREPAELRGYLRETRAAGHRIALVPTMGCLHEGHLSLLREGRKRGDVLVLSIFVNPLQFGPQEDFSRYPRAEARDLEQAELVGTDIAYLPAPETMYGSGFQTKVDVQQVSQGLCGARRPGHFVGVATVVLKLFHQVEPHVAVFGQKDYQQLQVIRRMVQDLDLDIEVVGMPIVREPDGLAMSSRNSYLSSDERSRAVALSRGLFAARDLYARGERRAAHLVATARAVIDEAGLRIDYLELCETDTLESVSRAHGSCALLAAVYAGTTRLIDNLVLTPPAP